MPSRRWLGELERVQRRAGSWRWLHLQATTRDHLQCDTAMTVGAAPPPVATPSYTSINQTSINTSKRNQPNLKISKEMSCWIMDGNHNQLNPGSGLGSGEAAIGAPDEAVLVAAGVGTETAGLVEVADLWGDAGSTGARKPGAAAPGASRGRRWSRATRRQQVVGWPWGRRLGVRRLGGGTGGRAGKKRWRKEPSDDGGGAHGRAGGAKRWRWFGAGLNRARGRPKEAASRGAKGRRCRRSRRQRRAEPGARAGRRAARRRWRPSGDRAAHPPYARGWRRRIPGRDRRRRSRRGRRRHGSSGYVVAAVGGEPGGDRTKLGGRR